MTKRKTEREAWETPSLEWIHRVRRERQATRGKRPVRPLTRPEAKRLASRYGLKLTKPS